MEVKSQLDPRKDNEVFALHHVFLPRVRRLLDRFVQGLNNLSVSEHLGNCGYLDASQTSTHPMLAILL